MFLPINFDTSVSFFIAQAKIERKIIIKKLTMYYAVTIQIFKYLVKNENSSILLSFITRI